MSRSKKGTKAGEIATSKWRKTMLEKYGGDGFHKRMQEIGKKGGSRSTPTGGFGNKNVGPDGLTGRQRASIAGRKGGRISSRKGVKNGEGKKYDKDIEEAERILEEESSSK